MIGLKTERLVFRQWTNADFERFSLFFSTEENAKYVGGVKTPEESYRLIATYIGHYVLHGYSYLAVAEKETKNLVGTVGLWNSPAWPEPELGYWLIPQFQGKGYGVEAGLAVKRYGLEFLGLKSLVSYIDPSNKPSVKLALKMGAHFDSSIDLLEFGKHDVYRYK